MKSFQVNGGKAVLWRDRRGWGWQAARRQTLSPPKPMRFRATLFYMTVSGMYATGWCRKMRDARRRAVRALADETSRVRAPQSRIRLVGA